MVDFGYIIIVASFLIYYFVVLVVEHKVISEPREIFEKFLSFGLLYAGISILYYAVTGTPFLNDTERSYTLYLFIIGFMAILWTVPNILSEFKFYRRFLKRK